MNTTDDLLQARDALHAAVSALLDPVVSRMSVRGRLVDLHGQSMLDQMRELVEGSTSGRGGGGRSRSPVPVDLGAIDLVQEIDRMTRTELWREDPARYFVGTTMVARAPVRYLTTEQRIRNAAKFVRRAATEAEHVTWLTELLQDWVARCRAHLDPERHLAVDCPACSARFVMREMAGEEVRVPALVTSPQGARCQACDHRWSGVVTPAVEVATAAVAG